METQIEITRTNTESLLIALQQLMLIERRHIAQLEAELAAYAQRYGVTAEARRLLTRGQGLRARPDGAGGVGG